MALTGEALEDLVMGLWESECQPGEVLQEQAQVMVEGLREDFQRAPVENSNLRLLEVVHR
jgi:hypothetical protein